MVEATIDLTRGIPAPEAFPIEDLVQCAEAILRRDAQVLLQYGGPCGYAPLRDWLGEQYGVGSEQIFVGNSSLEVFSFIAQITLQPGVRVFVESPSYDRAITLFRRAGAKVVGIPLRPDGWDLGVFGRAVAAGVTSYHVCYRGLSEPEWDDR